MKKAEAIKWMTDYVMSELRADREICIELKGRELITPFPSCVTALFGARELFEAFLRAMDKADDSFRKQGKKKYITPTWLVRVQ